MARSVERPGLVPATPENVRRAAQLLKQGELVVVPTETVYEPDAPVLRKGKTMTDEEKEDKALRDRTRNDTYLRRATDVLLGLKALGYGAQP